MKITIELDITDFEHVCILENCPIAFDFVGVGRLLEQVSQEIHSGAYHVFGEFHLENVANHQIGVLRIEQE